MANVKVKEYCGQIAALTFLCFLLLSIEGLARLFSPPPNRLERILAMLEQDADLLWKQRADLNTVFEGARVRTNSLGLRNKAIPRKTNENTTRIVCLGASPTFGWGVKEEQTYAYQLDQLLKKNAPQSKDVEVINAGVIGYSSHQGLQFLKNKILRLSPDIITVPYVINDVDKHRFFRSDGKTDKELKSKSKILTNIENLLDRSHLVNLLRKTVTQFQSAAVQYFGTIGKYQYIETRRVPIDDYKENLKSIIHIARQNGIKVVFLKMPVNLPSKKNVSESSHSKLDSYLADALALAKEKKFGKAIEKLKDAIVLDPFSSKAYYLLGKYYEQIGDGKQAHDNFKQAIKMELYECGYLGKDYNEIMERVAKEEQVVMVDMVSAFNQYAKENNKSLFLDSQHDTIHPNPLGHTIISQEIYKALIGNGLIDGIQLAKSKLEDE